jgi:predicted transcriptional regulator
MMAEAKKEDILAERLERLGGDDVSCCIPEYTEAAADIRAAPLFPVTLARVKALADENRLLAVSLLKRRGELCACEIQAATGLTHATVSHHMGVLAGAGLVSSRREGKWMYYRLADHPRISVP